LTLESSFIKTRGPKSETGTCSRQGTEPTARDSRQRENAAQPYPCFGPGVVPLAHFLMVPINTPWGFEEGDIQRVV